MTYRPHLKSISDDELLRRLAELLRQSRRVESELVAHIGEVDERRLYRREASPSMFAYCTEALQLSEHEAYLRIAVARASRKHPMLLEMLGDGRLHLSGIVKIAPHLTETNRETLLARAAGKSKREIEELVAELSPKPDVPAAMRKLPERREETTPRSELGPDRRLTKPGLAPTLCDARNRPRSGAPARAQPVVEPLAPAGILAVIQRGCQSELHQTAVQFTASAELHDKLARLRALMRSSVPDGDLAAIIEEAVTEKLERLESRRFAKTKAPRKKLEHTDTSPSSRYIPAAVKRTASERDGNQCTFVNANGKRCTERDRLDFHHQQPFARGGDHSPENVRMMCPAHNGYLAERDYGKEVMERYRRSGSCAREPAPVYLIDNKAAVNQAAMQCH